MPEQKVDMGEEEVVGAARELWQKYLFITQELLKFINQQDIEIFMEIVPQRSKIIEKLEALPSHEYRKLDEFKEIAEKIKPMDREIMYKARAWLNKSRRQNSVVRSYDLANGLIGSHSVSFNRKY